jgi:hypothetical protein
VLPIPGTFCSVDSAEPEDEPDGPEDAEESSDEDDDEDRLEEDDRVGVGCAEPLVSSEPWSPGAAGRSQERRHGLT